MDQKTNGIRAVNARAGGRRIILLALLSLTLMLGLLSSMAGIAFAAETTTPMAINLKSIGTSLSSTAYIEAVFDNTYQELTRVANAGVYVGNTELNYSSSYNSISSVNVGDYIVTGNTIQFYTSSLAEGENIVKFKNPDGGDDVSVKLKMAKTPGDGWFARDSYTIELIEDTPEKPTTFKVIWKNGNDTLETDENVAKDTKPSYDGDTPTKAKDENYTYNFAGWATEADATTGTAVANLPAVTADVTYYAIFNKAEKPLEQQLYVRLVGGFDHRMVNQQDDVDATSSATTGGSSYIEAASSVHVEYALVAEGTAQEDVPSDAWNKPDYFKNGNILQVDGAKSKINIEPECPGMHGEINPFSGDIHLRGVPKEAGNYKVSVYLSTNKGDATSNKLDFVVFSGNEKLINRLNYENSTKTNDGKYIFDQAPWYIGEFGGENETVTVPKDIKAWYGSHAELPEVNYSELGTVADRDGNGKPAEPSQTLIIPSGCNLTMVNMKVHSGVKIVVKKDAKLTLRQTTVDGIIEVEDGGTFSMDYNDYGNGDWLHGSSINGQLRMMDGSTLDHARITAHANYLAEYDNDTRRNFEPIVVTEGNVNIVGDVYILGENGPSGETGQPAILVKGTLNIPEGSTLAAYGGGDSLSATGGDAIQLDCGTITGAGNVIAVGGYAVNITSDSSKGKGGAAVSGTGEISVANAYLEGGSCVENIGTPGEALNGDIKIADTTNREVVNGSATLGDTSPQYWKGTGDSNGTVPAIDKTLKLVTENAPAGVQSGKTAIKVTAEWDDSENHDSESVEAIVKDKNGNTIRTITLSKDNDWTATVDGLNANQKYTVSASAEGAEKIEITKSTHGDTWSEMPFGAIDDGKTYIITYQDDKKTYLLGVKDSSIGKAEWNNESPAALGNEFKWIPEKSGSKTYGEWYLMNQAGEKNTYLGMKQNGLDVIPCMYTKDSSTYFTLFADDDGSLWNKFLNKNFIVSDGKLTTSGSNYTEFTFYQQMSSETEDFVFKITAKADNNSDPGADENGVNGNVENNGENAGDNTGGNSGSNTGGNTGGNGSGSASTGGNSGGTSAGGSSSGGSTGGGSTGTIDILKQAIDNAKVIKASDYSADSYKALAEALEAGEKIAADKTATQKQRTDAANAINAARAALVKAPEVPAIQPGDTVTVSDQEYIILTTPATDTTGNGTASLSHAKNSASVSIPATVKLADGKTYKVTTIAAGAFKGSKATKVTVGKNVKKVSKNAFSKSKVKTLVVKTKKLTKASIKGSLKGSKVKTIKVKVGKKGVNKKYVKKYKKIFTKKIAGKKVKVK